MRENLRIMVVDNDPEIIKSAWRVLNQEGHAVEGVFSGTDAIHKLKENNYDLVFTELSMPGIDGITLIRWTRQYRPAIGIVTITGNHLKKTIKETQELGIISHMKKPLTPEMFKDATNKAIEWIRENTSKNEQEEEFHPEMLAELDNVINQYGGMPSHATRVLLDAQDLFGYIPSSIQKRIAEGLNMHPSKIRRIVSFHSCFRTEPEAVHNTSYMSGIEKAWNSVTWMTGNKALHAVDEFIKGRQLES
jgi:CheY-like chemotaxis protein